MSATAATPPAAAAAAAAAVVDVSIISVSSVLIEYESGEIESDEKIDCLTGAALD
jgi:hypothetical protein